MSTIRIFSAEEARNQLLDDQYDELSELVCTLGPELLTRGMKPEEANAALIACLKDLHLRAARAEKREKEALEDKTNALNRLQLANRIIDALPSWHGMDVDDSFGALLEAFDDSRTPPNWKERR